VEYSTEDKFERFAFKANTNFSGLAIDRTLKVNVLNDHAIYNLFYVYKSTPGGTLNCTVTYMDGTSYSFTRTVTQGTGAWGTKILKIDLNDVPDKENVISLEVTPPRWGSLERDLVLGVLVPAGTEFEAVSRDQLGRVFCKLNHLQQFERYEYDGLGRVVKVFDARGDVLQEFGYNEIAITN
jgi:YD repeat-containing protein